MHAGRPLQHSFPPQIFVEDESGEMLTLSRQVAILIKYVKALQSAELESVRDKVLGWVRDIPPAGRSEDLLNELRKKFKLTDSQIEAELTPRATEDFDALVPTKGWLKDYVDYTRKTEPPTVFHFFAGMAAIGAALARNVFFDMGAYQIFPNLCVVIVAPTGKCRKTSACNVAINLYRATGGNVLADKVTPEALITAFQDRSSATGIIYAPELAVFLGKQKYQEGMVPLLTALFDCPKEWSSGTVMRGEQHLRNVALSSLMCSTMDWIQTAIPKDAFGGGFMSRLLFVVQNDTPRVFPHPPPFSKEMEHSLKHRLFHIQRLRGKFQITPEADEWYVKWYAKHKETPSAERQYAGYMERKPDHLHRIAMVLAVSELQLEQHEDLLLTPLHLQRALQILNWVEDYLPEAFAEMSQNAIGEEHGRIIKQLRQKDGQMPHSMLLRANRHRMNARQFRETMETLRQSKLVDYDGASKVYSLTPEGWSKQ